MQIRYRKARDPRPEPGARFNIKRGEKWQKKNDTENEAAIKVATLQW